MLVKLEVHFGALFAADLNVVIARTWKRRDANGEHRMVMTNNTLHVHNDDTVLLCNRCKIEVSTTLENVVEKTTVENTTIRMNCVFRIMLTFIPSLFS
jgi:hypothetical protein